MPPCAMKLSTLYLPSSTRPTKDSGDSCKTSPSSGQKDSVSGNVLLHAAQNFISEFVSPVPKRPAKGLTSAGGLEAVREISRLARSNARVKLRWSGSFHT